MKRRNIEDDLLMFMACFGKGTVAAICEEMEAFMTKYVAKMDGFRCFDMPLNVLENDRICPINTGFEIEILEGVCLR